MVFRLRFRRAGIFTIAIHLIGIAVGITFLVQAIISATTSEAAEISLFLKKLLPAGNCLCESSTTFDCKLSLPDFYGQKGNTGKDVVAAASVVTRKHHIGDNRLSPIAVEHIKSHEIGDDPWQFQFGRDDDNAGLSDSQCKSAFPGLFEDIYRAVKLRVDQNTSISVSDLDSINVSVGMVRAMIIDGKLSILESQYMDSDHRKKGLAILSSIYRSITISERRIPNVEFVFSIEDMVQHPAQPLWSLTRRPQDEQLWLIPDFGFWSWDIEDLGTFDSVVEQVVRDEAKLPWEDKIQKLVWRGSVRRAPKLRRALLDASKSKPWNGVEILNEMALNVFNNYLSAADQCKYMFVAHLEGRSYSGSLKYRQICKSVVVIHKLQWIQHHHYLLVASGPNQNYVEVERDFSDLDAVMVHLIANPEEAKRIADNNVKTFRERYLTMAAEACYWRALIEGWASVSFEPDLYERKRNGGNSRKRRGMRFENYVLIESDKQMNFRTG